MKSDLSNTVTAHATTLPENVRIPLHSLQADLGYLIGRVIADGSSGPMVVQSMKDRLDQIEAYFREPAPSGNTSSPAIIKTLEAAEQFIVNGVDYGFINMPDTGDPAHDTLPAIRAALKGLRSCTANSAQDSARGVLAEKINLAYLLTINAGGPTERHLTSEEFATVLAALSAAPVSAWQITDDMVEAAAKAQWEMVIKHGYEDALWADVDVEKREACLHINRTALEAAFARARNEGVSHD